MIPALQRLASARLLTIVAFVLFGSLLSTLAVADERPKRLLLIGQGPDNHPPTTHEYLPGLERLAKLLAGVEGLSVTVVKADEPWTEGPELLAKADGAVLFLSEGARWCQNDPRRYEALLRLAARRGGLSAIHWAIGTKDAAPITAFVKLFGGCHGGPDRKYQVVETEARPAEPRHPIATGLDAFRVRDEFYYQLKFAQPATAIHPVLEVTIDGGPQTVAWAFDRPDGGRSFGFSGLHFDDNWRLAPYRALVVNGVLWTLGLPVGAAASGQ